MSDYEPDWTDQEIRDARFADHTFTLQRVQAGTLQRVRDGVKTFVPAVQLMIEDEAGEVATMTLLMPDMMWTSLVVEILMSQGGREFHERIKALVEEMR